jgi:hypothetical protein
LLLQGKVCGAVSSVWLLRRRRHGRRGVVGGGREIFSGRSAVSLSPRRRRHVSAVERAVVYTAWVALSLCCRQHGTHGDWRGDGEERTAAARRGGLGRPPGTEKEQNLARTCGLSLCLPAKARGRASGGLERERHHHGFLLRAPRSDPRRRRCTSPGHLVVIAPCARGSHPLLGLAGRPPPRREAAP